jgi:hypothetical protein
MVGMAGIFIYFNLKLHQSVDPAFAKAAILDAFSSIMIRNSSSSSSDSNKSLPSLGMHNNGPSASMTLDSATKEGATVV